ncbi:SwmB domain-containing protein [uncultured Roseobacter sp.]|uniref:SwmB domain-containing protein n=1 Tax=uncultured Roseobacter sp. TaxID=114847 RepID=UPI0026294271|nr:SwmB domain-containing protein [uncultured Roseobacter sp.]
MPRTIWTKPQSDPNGNWTRHEGDPPFSIAAIGGVPYDVRTDTDESFVITPTASAAPPLISGLPLLNGLPEIGQTLVATPAPSAGTAPISTNWQWLRNGAEIPGATTATFALGADEEGNAISVRQIDSNIAGSDSVTAAAITVVSTSGAAAVISSLLVTDQTATGEVELAYSIDSDSTVSGVVTRSASPPSATQILAGLDDTGTIAASAFFDVWTTAGNDTLPDIASGLTADTYYLHVVPAGSGDGGVVSSNGFRLETEAPQIVAAQTSTSGLEIEVAFSETLAGDTSADDWTLRVDGAALNITAVSFSATSVRLSLAAQVASGQILTLSYSGNTLTDTVGNSVDLVADLDVNNRVSGTFIENSVTVTPGDYLTAADPLPTDARALLFFASLTQDSGTGGRLALATWDGTSGGFHSDYNSTNGTGGVRLRMQGGTASISENTEPVALGTRYHLLISGWINASDVMNVRAWIFDTSIGNWAEAVNVTDPLASPAAFRLNANPLRLFTRSDGTGHPFTGTINRLALWAAPQNTPIADISNIDAQALFAEADGMKDPALSRLSLGQPLVDFDGDAAAYNAGIHSGTLGTFLRSGNFT